jgi:hypothetical protein
MYFFLLNKCGFGLVGVVLKMARLIKDGPMKGGKNEGMKVALRKTPLEILWHSWQKFCVDH